MIKQRKTCPKQSQTAKDYWRVTEEITQSTLFMISVPCRFFIQKWYKLGLGNKLKVLFIYFKKDFCQAWYKRSEFDAQADFLANKMIRNPNWALNLIDKVEDWSKKFMIESKKILKLSLAKIKVQEMIKAYKKVLKWQELSHGVGPSVSWHADADKERVTKTITKIIERQIKKRKLNLEPASVFSLLSTPTEESFVAKEEKEFLKIARKVFIRPKIKKVFKKEKLELLEGRIKKTDPQIFRLFYNHFKK